MRDSEAEEFQMKTNEVLPVTDAVRDNILQRLSDVTERHIHITSTFQEDSLLLAIGDLLCMYEYLSHKYEMQTQISAELACRAVELEKLQKSVSELKDFVAEYIGHVLHTEDKSLINEVFEEMTEER